MPISFGSSGDLFEFHDLGAVEVKGFPRAIPAWQVVRQSAVESRFEALRASLLTPLVGREEELGFLLDRWARAKDGKGQWSWSRARPVSVNRGSLPRSPIDCGGSRAFVCVISAVLITKTVRSIR